MACKDVDRTDSAFWSPLIFCDGLASVDLQENVTNTFAAFSSSNDKGFASAEEFEMRVEVFKENIVQLQELNTNLSDYIVGAPAIC